MFGCSHSDLGVGHGEGLLEGVVSVSSDEVLEKELRVCEVGGIVLEGLSVASHESLLEVSAEPDPLLHGIASEEVLSLLHEFISTELHVLVEQVAAEDLLAILVIDKVDVVEQRAQGHLGHEGVVLVVEEGVVVVQEHQLKHSLDYACKMSFLRFQYWGNRLTEIIEAWKMNFL